MIAAHCIHKYSKALKFHADGAMMCVSWCMLVHPTGMQLEQCELRNDLHLITFLSTCTSWPSFAHEMPTKVAPMCNDSSCMP